MKWLTIDWIRKHSRIDLNCDDELLELYGESAEETVLNVCSRTIEDIVEEYGQIPKPLFHASLLLVDESYKNRSPYDEHNISTAPDGFDILVKPYMRLSGFSAQTNTQEYGRHCNL
jgi:uncharacterized phage protein (predicted DNA packaging)